MYPLPIPGLLSSILAWQEDPVVSWVLTVAVAQWAMLAMMDTHEPGSLRSPKSGSSPSQSSSQEVGGKGEK